jgi:hypothetical protein
VPGEASANGPAVAGARAKPAASTRASAGGARGSRRPARRKRTTTPAPLATGARPIAIPAQGFEVEDVRVGRGVEPPSRFELASSLVELAGDGVEAVVKSSVSAAGTLIKRTIELIPKP